MKHVLLSLFFLSGLPAYSEQAEENKRTCRIVFPERSHKDAKTVYLYDGEKNHRVFLPSMTFSKVIHLPKGELTLAMVADGVSDPENVPAGAPTLKIAEDVRDFYILVTPDPSNETLPVQIRKVDASDAKFTSGNTLWFNLTEHRIMAKLGESKMSVEPKGSTISKGPMVNGGYYRAEFTYQLQAKGEARRITEQQWWHDSNCRHLGVIVSSRRLPKIFFYRDFRPETSSSG